MRAPFVVLLLSVPASAADWPHFLGPTRDNFTPEKVAPWKGKLTEVWKKPVGDARKLGPSAVSFTWPVPSMRTVRGPKR